MTLDAAALSRLKVKDLQRELKKRGLDSSGLKAALLQRLKEHLLQEDGAETKPEEVEKEKEEEEEDAQEASDKDEDRDEETEAPGDTEEKKDEPLKEQDTESNGGDTEDKPETVTGVKRGVDDEGGEDALFIAKKAKVAEGVEASSPQPEDENDDKPTPAADAASREKQAGEDTEAKTDQGHRTTVRIDNFVRPFTLNAVKALVQECGDYAEDGFWMDAIKTHCFVTYPSAEIAEKTAASIDGKTWPQENGRSLRAKLVDHTAMEVSQYGEANLPSRPKNNGTQATQRQKVTIDEFFQKTETKPVLYYLPLTDEQVKERKQHQSQRPEGLPRKRRHRGGRKRNRRARFRR